MAISPAPKPPVTEVYRHSLSTDIYLGAVHGDFAPEMGGAGRLTQAVLGFVPVIGNICAGRDMIADFRQHDTVGAVLNAFAMLPFIGGISKLAAVVRAFRRAGRILKAGRIMSSQVPVNGPVAPR